MSALDPAVAFYHGVIGLALRGRSKEFAWLRTADDVELMLHEREAEPSDSAAAPGFFVADVGGAVEAWRSQGGTVLDEPTRRPWGETMAVVRDADGHMVCLSSR